MSSFNPRTKEVEVSTKLRVAAKGQTVVVVLGFHRSGTSLVARILHELGVTMGDNKGENGDSKGMLIGDSVENPTGYYEDEDFIDLNAQLMTKAGGGWDNPPSTSRLMATFKSNESTLPMIEEVLLKKFQRGHAVWGWKDPRTVITWPLLAPFIPNRKFIVVSRNPEPAINSLLHRERNNMSVQKAMALYTDCQIRINRHVKNEPKESLYTIQYEALLDDLHFRTTYIKSMAMFIGLDDITDETNEKMQKIADLIDPALNRSDYELGLV